MARPLGKRDVGRVLARIRVSRSASVPELHQLAKQEMALIMRRVPYIWYALHEYEVDHGKLPRFVLHSQYDDGSKKADVWEVEVTLEECDDTNDFLVITLEPQ